MKKIFYITLTICLCIAFGLFLINQNTDIIKNLKIRTADQVKKDEVKYSLKNSPFYKQYFSKKNLIVFNIWATWCEPCLKEMSVLNKVKKQMNNSDIIFLSYSLDNDSLKIKNFNASKRFDFKDITLENYSYKNSILLALDANKNEINNSIINISSTELPETFIIKNGKVVYITKGMINYEDFLEKLKSFNPQK